MTSFTNHRFRFAVLAVFAFLAAGLFFRYHSPTLHPGGSPASEKEESAEKNLREGLYPSEWFHAVREYPVFRPDIQAYTDAMAEAHRAVQNRSGISGFDAAWTVQGPGNIGARVNTVKVHPSNPNIIYAGYSQGGVWKTTDGGQTWAPIFDEQPYLAVSDIELDPQNPNTVYVGTGDHNIGGYPFIGDGVWKSTNGGQTWQHLGLEKQRIISKIIVHPTDSKTLFAATMGLPFERNNDRGLYRSTNGGQTWQQVLFVSDSTGVIDMVISPTNPNVLYAAAWDRIRNNHESVVTGLNARIWKSTNGGTNWTKLAGGLPEDEKCRIGLAIDPQNDQHVLALYAGANLSFDAIYETANGGANWQPMNAEGLDPGFQSSFSWYFGKIYINPFKKNQVFALGVELWRSENGGQNWEQVTPPWWEYVVHADMHAMDFIDADTYLLGTDGGLYQTDDNAVNWTKIENIPASQFYRVAYNPHTPDLYYGGMQDNGTSGGNAADPNNWIRLFGGDGFQPVFHPTDPNIYYFETQNGGIAGTADGTGFFDDATVGIDGEDRRHWDMQYILSPHNGQAMYTGTYRVYLGFGHLPTWVPISDDLTDGIIFGSRYHTISTLHESPLTEGRLYVGTTDGNVWIGDVNTFDWKNISAGLPDRYVSCVKASPSAANRVFVTHTGYRDNDFSPRIHRSDDLGKNWKPIASDLPNLAINDLFILPGRQDSVLFVATDGGVYGTVDAGTHWERLGTGMPTVPVYDLEWNVAQNTLIAGTFARSIMTFPLDSLKTDPSIGTHTPVADARLRIHPNPAAATTNLSFEKLPASATLSVVRLSGQTVWEKNLDTAPAQRFSLDTGGFEPGVYLVVLRSKGRLVTTEKLVVARR